MIGDGSIGGVEAAIPATETLIRHDAPARNFTESTPLGNGRLGAMIFGDPHDERVVLNENSMWSGSPQQADRAGAATALPEIRRLLFAGKNAEAEQLVNETFTCLGPGSGTGKGAKVPFGCYQVLGNLHLRFHYPAESAVSNYRRTLDLARAVMNITYSRGDAKYQREAFVSAVDDAFALRLTCDKGGRISFRVNLDRPERFKTVSDFPDSLLMTGYLDDGRGGAGVSYAARLRVMSKGGKLVQNEGTLQLEGADEALIFVTAVTDMTSFAGRNIDDPVAVSAADLAKASAQSYEELRKAHLSDYQSYFGRVELTVQTPNSDLAVKSTPERLRAFAKHDADITLPVLYFNFGRYLLISSSRPGCLPANLQGLWAEEIQTPWNADWHLNVNVQMNYWPAEVCNLSELHEPLFKLIESLEKPGALTAQAYYGARGWIAHVNANPWGFTSPGESASWGSAASGAAWLCQHIWDHYLFTRDETFLRWAYPVLQGSARFYADFLCELPEKGWLVTAPSNSPENGFRLPDGRCCHVCLGPTLDMQVLRYLFGACIEASQQLQVDEQFREELKDCLPRLAPTQIGQDGRIMEWIEEYDETEPLHRHVSHLWGLYPGHELTPTDAPRYAAAARKSLEARGLDGVGWSLAYKVLLWARLRDGGRAWELLHKALTPAEGLAIRFDGGGGVYPNLFDASPPFQIDGNFGATAGIAEMLLQSHAGEIHLLPALPAAWTNGSVRGLRGRGGFEISMQWHDSKLSSASVRSFIGGICKLRSGKEVVEFPTTAGATYKLDGQLKQHL